MSIIVPLESFSFKVGLVRALKIPNSTLQTISSDCTRGLSLENGIASIWDLENGKKVRELRKLDSNPLYTLERMLDSSFSSDNKYVACLSNWWLYLFEISSGELIWKIESYVDLEDTMSFRVENNFYVKISTDNKYIASVGDTTTLRDFKSGEIIWTDKDLAGESLQFSNDGKHILVDYSLKELKSGILVREFTVEEGDEYWELNHDQSAISPNNNYIAGTFGLGAMIVWDINGNIKFKLRKPNLMENYSEVGLNVHFSPDEKYIASINFHRNKIDIWDMKTGKLYDEINHETEILNFRFIPNENFIIFSDEKGYIFIIDYLQNKIQSLDSPKEKIDDVRKLISKGEGQKIEFKSSLRWDIKRNRANKELEHVIVKVISGFLNSKGGTMLIGVSDEKKIIGLKHDYNSLRKKDKDGFQLQLVQVIKKYIGLHLSDYWNFYFVNIDGKDICIINVKKSPEPVHTKEYKNKNEEAFFIRKGSSTQKLTRSDEIKYITLHFKR